MMIRYLFGEVAEKNLDEVTIEVAGVGYGVKVSAYDYESFILGQKIKVFVYENIKEDTYDLYGSTRPEVMVLFRQLLSVKNVGPKVAMALLGLGSDKTVKEAIAGGDVKKLQSAKGVGKRAAEQIIVELRDKVGLIASEDAEGVVTRGGVDVSDEAVQALVALGYSEYDAQSALKHTDPGLSTEDRIKQALKGNF